MAMQVLTRAFIIPGGRDAAPLCRGTWEPGMRPGTDRQQRAHQRYRQGKIVFEIPQVPLSLSLKWQFGNKTVAKLPSVRFG